MRITPLLAGALALAIAQQTLAEDGGDRPEMMMPVVPIGMISDAEAAAQRSIEKRRSREQVPADAEAPESSEDEQETRIIEVTPGVNEIIPISIGHLNRVVLPFADPVVRTTSEANYEIHDQVLYVATGHSAPVTMYVTPRGNEAMAISLTLAPRRIAPVEMTLKYSGGAGHQMAPMRNQRAERWERSKPYVETLRNVLRTVAIGDVPPGYSISEDPLHTYFGACDQAGLEYEFLDGQAVTGNHFRINVGIVRNTTNQPIEVVESNCAASDVAAVSTWPNTLLNPGQATEIYVVRTVDQPGTGRQNARRRFLVGGEQ